MRMRRYKLKHYDGRYPLHYEYEYSRYITQSYIKTRKITTLPCRLYKPSRMSKALR